MNISYKRRYLAYLQEHNDGSEEAAELISHMERECGYADTEAYSVCEEDLNCLTENQRDLLRQKLGKQKDSAFTPDDMQRIADAISDCISEEFTENLVSAIEYEL